MRSPCGCAVQLQESRGRALPSPTSSPCRHDAASRHEARPNVVVSAADWPALDDALAAAIEASEPLPAVSVPAASDAEPAWAAKTRSALSRAAADTAAGAAEEGSAAAPLLPGGTDLPAAVAAQGSQVRVGARLTDCLFDGGACVCFGLRPSCTQGLIP